MPNGLKGFQKGHKTNIGRPCSIETRQKLSLAFSKPYKPEYKICKFCKEKFYPKFSHVHWERVKFCSHNCSCQFNKTLFREKSHHWKGGKMISHGYCFIYNPSHPFSSNGYIREHRLVVEKFLGRYLKLEEVVHHINGNKLDNRIENLYLFPNRKAHFGFRHFNTKLKSNIHS